jgi:shikimate dehydrogenase
VDPAPGDRRRLAVLGHPVAHSRSPAMQNAALAALGLGEGWSYEAIDVAPGGFADRVRAMPAEGFVGANATVPHKLAALAVADEASAAARAIGAANTLSFRDGRIAADNTDGEGLIAALGDSPRGLRALVLGAGGAGRAAAWALAEAGAEVAVWNRTEARAAALAEELGVSAVAGTGGLEIAGYDLVVNATTIGLAPDGPSLEALPFDPAELGGVEAVVDLVYGGAETALAAAARRAGARVVDGLEVLVRQGAASLRIWTGREPPIETMRAAARAGR